MNDTTVTESALAERLSELESEDNHAETLRHADGSVTVVMCDEDAYDHDSPRDYDGNVATLIMDDDSNYLDLDSDDAGLSEARDRWDWLGTYGYSSRGQRFPGKLNATEKALTQYDRAEIMERYVAMFRDDIAYYCDEWTVSGSTQSDWARGWGYVTTDTLNDAFPSGVPADWSAEKAFDAELRVYQQHFAGEYYYAIHLSPKPAELVSTVVDYGSDPVETYGDDYDEDSCYGFLGYDNLADIAGNFTSSEVIS